MLSKGCLLSGRRESEEAGSIGCSDRPGICKGLDKGLADTSANIAIPDACPTLPATSRHRGRVASQTQAVNLLGDEDMKEGSYSLGTTNGKVVSSIKYAQSRSPTETLSGDESDGRYCAIVEEESPTMVDHQGKRSYACPYFRLDPIRHIECLSRKLYRIQDVKQHLSRRHYEDSGRAPKSAGNILGVTLPTQKELKARSNRKRSPEDQWHKIWRTLFKRPLPNQGPYLRTTKEEIVGIAAGICKEESNGDTSGSWKNGELPGAKGKFAQQLIEGLLNGYRSPSDQYAEQEEPKSVAAEQGQPRKTMELERGAADGNIDALPVTVTGGDQESIIPPYHFPTSDLQMLSSSDITMEGVDLMDFGQDSDTTAKSMDQSALALYDKGGEITMPLSCVPASEGNMEELDLLDLSQNTETSNLLSRDKPKDPSY
ncbi:hypothetical protein F53441_2688 [Fusarium austroafricanum]|uniref:Uncharacterized protein n=1 Tax=Fusarium austroafricanum TaxID=2364996 RepID=A0A8H4KRJ2_9HYPO|nr:hypothetical protein F53441_2688 [Fusarium austroafricanum]